MNQLQITGGPPLYIITISAGEDGSYNASFMQQRIPVAGLEPETPASDLPVTLRLLAASLPAVDPEEEIPFFPSVTFLITVHREDDGGLMAMLGAAGPTVGEEIPIPFGLAGFIEVVADQMQNRIDNAGIGLADPTSL